MENGFGSKPRESRVLQVWGQIYLKPGLKTRYSDYLQAFPDLIGFSGLCL